MAQYVDVHCACMSHELNFSQMKRSQIIKYIRSRVKSSDIDDSSIRKTLNFDSPPPAKSTKKSDFTDNSYSNLDKNEEFKKPKKAETIDEILELLENTKIESSENNMQ